MRVNTNPWIENTGTVPDEVGPDTVIEVEYRDGRMYEWPVGLSGGNADPDLWSFTGHFDIIRWRLA